MLAAQLSIAGIALMMLLRQTYSYFLLLILLSLTGVRHPPTANDRIPLGWRRHVVGWVTMVFFVIGFTPNPIFVTPNSAVESQPVQQQEQPRERRERRPPVRDHRVDPRFVNPQRIVDRQQVVPAEQPDAADTSLPVTVSKFNAASAGTDS